jgi:hypothetical protein
MKILRTAFLLAAIAGSKQMQAQCGTRNARAFLEVSFPGTIPVGENGRPLRHAADSTFTIYLESAGARIDGGRAWIGNRSYTVNAFRVTEFPVAPGHDKNSGNAIVIPATASKMWRLWRLELTPVTKGKKKAPAKTGAQKAVLQLSAGGKQCVQTIGSITELAVKPTV